MENNLELKINYSGDNNEDIARALSDQLFSYTQFILSNVNHNENSLKMSFYSNGELVKDKVFIPEVPVEEPADEQTNNSSVILPN